MVKMMMMMVNLNEKDDHSKVGWQVQETVGLLEHWRHPCQYFISRKHRTVFNCSLRVQYKNEQKKRLANQSSCHEAFYD